MGLSEHALKMPINLSENDILSQLIYRGEGNSSIVVALKTKAKVIRLLKKNGKIMKTSQDHHVTQHPMRNIKFIHLIMKPLTKPFLGATELVHLKSNFINLLSEKVEAERPLHRLDKTLHLDDQYALIMDDLCTLPAQLTRQLRPENFLGPTISIEIKPKQGFLPIHPRLFLKSCTNDQLANSIRNSCLYGLTQELKLARGRIEKTSNYCPINLFSGCPVKMKYALEGLLLNPQNNLRIFKDLILAYDEANQLKLSDVIQNLFHCHEESVISCHASNNQPTNNLERLIDLLIQCLLNEHVEKSCELSMTSEQDDENLSSPRDNCLLHSSTNECRRCDTQPSSKKCKFDSTLNSSHTLPKACVLSSVLRAQKLDTIGPHEAHMMLNWLLCDARSSDSNLDILEELSKPQTPDGFGLPHQLPHETQQKYYFRKVWEFLVSLTAKDCSIIITIRRVILGHFESIIKNRPGIASHMLKEHRSGNYYMFNVGIADLDQKMPLKIPRICDSLLQIAAMKSCSQTCEPTSEII